jgi:hypothetical protein
LALGGLGKPETFNFLKTDGRIGGDWDTVKALRLMIPQAFLLRACEVIE